MRGVGYRFRDDEAARWNATNEPRPGRAAPSSPLGSVRFRLVLLSFAITSAAVGFVYLYVVPQLCSSLTAERLERLEAQGGEELDRLRGGGRAGPRTARASELVRRTAANVDARVTLLGVRDGEPELRDRRLRARERRGRPPTYPAARRR